ncbi:major outer sheath N-terminal domain-containing protein, partial [Treponema pallidum]
MRCHENGHVRCAAARGARGDTKLPLRTENCKYSAPPPPCLPEEGAELRLKDLTVDFESPKPGQAFTLKKPKASFEATLHCYN